MKAAIITIGDEILIGDTVDTNATWLAKSLDEIGIQVKVVYTIGDYESEIHKHLDLLMGQCELVLITGGLGPTHDDVTKYSLTRYFKDELVFNEEAFADLEKLLKTFGKTVSETNRTQCLLPSSCLRIPNKFGTASGMQFDQKGTVVISMPGVPREMKHMMTQYILPRLEQDSGGAKLNHRYLRTFGVAEAELSNQLKAAIVALNENIKVAFLPSPGHVTIRISAINQDQTILLDEIEQSFINGIGSSYYGSSKDSIAAVVGKALDLSKQTLCTAESCTGGRLAALVTANPGSSAYYLGSILAYSNDVKTQLLKVDPDKIAKYGAVSEEVVTEMALHAQQIFGTNYALATSGIAGPDGGTADKPVGTVWLALSTSKGVETKKLNLGYSREINAQLSSVYALDMLRKELIKNI